MIVEIFIFLLTMSFIFFLYKHKQVHKYFDDRGMKYVPGLPMFGNLYKSTVRQQHIIDDLDDVYKAFPEERYVGYIERTKPVYLVRDPELIKTIVVKDFDHFIDHKDIFPEEMEPIVACSLLMMKGEKWQDMRTTLSPAFTASKIKKMMPLMMEISNNIIEYLREHAGEDIDVENLTRRYTSDVIASTAFGLQVNSLKDRDNEFYMTGQEMFKFSHFQRIVYFLSSCFPSLFKRLRIPFFSVKTINFFTNLATSTMEHREKNNIERPDMIQLLMEASKGSLKADNDGNDHFTLSENTFKPKAVQRKWTQIELVAQVFIFFVAGYESSATALSMCVHELALSPDVQEKLYQELRGFKEEHGELTYEKLNNLKYLDCVSNETSRKWVLAFFMDRVCNKPYELPPPRKGGKPVQLKRGDIVYNVVNPIHMDPEYFPNPQKFDPDRFSDENKHKIKPFTYMPFGVGPRSCIGSRFTLLELKVLIYHLVLNFKIVRCSKTSDPLVIKPHEFHITAKGGSWARLEPRT